MNQSETDLGIVNESQLLRFGIRINFGEIFGAVRFSTFSTQSATTGLIHCSKTGAAIDATSSAQLARGFMQSD
jgi:hypothetical protein